MQTESIKSSHLNIRISETLSLNLEEQLRLFQLLENPPPINSKLAKAIERYKCVIPQKL